MNFLQVAVVKSLDCKNLAPVLPEENENFDGSLVLDDVTSASKLGARSIRPEFPKIPVQNPRVLTIWLKNPEISV